MILSKGACPRRRHLSEVSLLNCHSKSLLLDSKSVGTYLPAYCGVGSLLAWSAVKQNYARSIPGSVK